jgi:hypothetical protein
MEPPKRPARAPAQPPEAPPKARRNRKHGRLLRFFRGYLMVAGALATAYVLERLLVALFVEIGKWM